MNPSFVASFAPGTRLTAETSHFWVDLILGGVVLLAIGITFYEWIVAWTRARALSEEGQRRRGLRPGPVLLFGKPEPVDAPPRSGAFVELVIEQLGVQHHSKNGHYVVWTERARELHHEPFYLRLESGERVLVEPGGRVELVDVLEPPTRQTGTSFRRRRARVTPDEKIWVRGVLSGGGADAGPYRGGGGAPLALKPPSRGSLFISTQPIELEDEQTARFHRNFGLMFLTALALLQLALFADYRSLRARGVNGEAIIRDARSWTTRSKNTTTHHWGWTLEVRTANGSASVRVETNAGAYGQRSIGDSVPIIYLPSDPTVLQLGTGGEVGETFGRVMVGAMGFFGLCLVYVIVGQARRPWWRRKLIVDQEKGSLHN